MSVNRRMQPYLLLRNEPERTESGAEKEKWVVEGTVQAAVYKKNDMRVAASEKYVESTHTALVICKNISADGCRLFGDGITYEVLDSNPEGRLTNLILKAVIPWPIMINSRQV